MALAFEAVLPGPFFDKAFKNELKATLEHIGDGMLDDFERTVKTWDESPDFQYELEDNDTFMAVHVFCDALLNGDRIRGVTGPNPAPMNLVYYFLNFGTDIRYARMMKGFRPKTQVGVLNSFPGWGWVVEVNVNEPQPGILARRWDEAIRKKVKRTIRQRVEDALNRAVIGSGHAYTGSNP